MAGLFNALNAARTSLEVNQKSIEIIGNNISNVNTEGYSRQQAVLETYPATNFGDFFIGQGVKVSDVSRLHDVYIEKEIQDKSMDYGYQDALTRPLSELEAVFSVTDDNISTDIDNFFDSLHELSATSKVDTVNSQLAEVADLNDRIHQIEIHGQTANSARDQRDMVIKSLAVTIGAETYETENGMVSVHLPGGLPLVEGNMAMTISAVTNGSNVELQLHAGGVTRELSEKTLGGQFKGIVEMRDSFIPDLEADMDKLAYEVSTQVNLQHAQGGALDSTTGNLFFSRPPNHVFSPPDPPPTATEYADAARQISVVITDPRKIAAGEAPAEDGDSIAIGDNRNALALANIGADYLIDGIDNFNSLYGKITARVGVESNQNQLSLKGAEDALVQLENFRDGLVGVSLEEEMISLIQFQRGFESSAKFLSTVDEMMTTILEIKR